jgi:hypothetical protein
MRSHLHLSDDVLRAALAPDRELAVPPGLLDAISAEAHRTAQRRALVAWPWAPGQLGPGLTSAHRVAWVLAAAALLLALLAGSLIGAGILNERSRPGARTGLSGRVLAVSAAEAWVAGDRGIWHYLDGAWVGPLVLPGTLGRANARSIALASDGTLWVATDEGVAALNGGRWTVPWGTGAESIAVDPTGTAWVFSPADRDVVALRLDGSAPRVVACGIGAPLMAVAADGLVYVGSYSYAGAAGLARISGDTCERVYPLGDGRDHEVGDLAADARGGLVALLLDGLPDGSGWSGRLVRFDGTRWAVLEVLPHAPALPYDVTLTPSGEVWRMSTPNGLPGDDLATAIQRMENGRWVPVATDGEGMLTSEVGAGAFGVSIALDGSVWFGGPSGIHRIVPATARPGFTIPGGPR